MNPKTKRGAFSVVIRGVFLSGLVWTTIACNQTNAGTGEKASKPKTRQVKPVTVAVEKPTIGTALSLYRTTASIEATSDAQIHARSTGVIEQLSAEEGDIVKANQLLLVLENQDQKLQVKQAQLALERAELDHNRKIDMHKAGVLSEQEFQDTQNTLKARKADLEVAELALSRTEIRAPFEGTIVRRYVDLGDHVQAGEELFSLMDMTPLLVRLHLPSNRMGSIRQGQDLEMHLDSTDTVLMAKVALISPIVDPDTGTVKVTAEINQYPPNTRPGDFATVAIVVEAHENAMLVPSIAVIEEQGRSILYVVEDGKAAKRDVEVGFVEQGQTEILTGLAPEEQVVVKGQRNLRPDIPVEILDGDVVVPPKSKGPESVL